ncbi:hypothetical protein JHD48_08895 [Sulfurimonas sp. SAG-AH-194-I05]|nr:hypothetical protein [Sulfurimonas sp. SAG-AH-194-I05]
MKNILLGLLVSLSIIGCSSDTKPEVNVEPALVVGKSLSSLSLNDQFEKANGIADTTKKVIFVFSDDMGHLCNDYFVTKEASYLSNNNTQFVADISAAPSLIRSMFIMPGLKDFKHPVLILSEKEVSAPYRAKMNTEKAVVVYVSNKEITSIKTISTKEELISTIEAK